MKPKWLNRNEYPFNSRYLDLKGSKLHYIDEGNGEILLFVHGTPSWSFEYRNIIKSLSRNFRCIAYDHIGFGLSDKPADYDYSTQNHSKVLAEFVMRLGLENITLLVHDFGGPIGLNFAIHHPEKIKKLVILNSWMWSSEKDPEFIKFSKILNSPLLPFLYLRLNFSARFLLPKSWGNKKLPKEIHKHYTKPFSSKNERLGTLAFARSLINDQHWFEELWNRKSAISNKPVLFIWGMKDAFIKPKYLEKFESGFQNSITLKLPDAGHFPQEENYNEVADSIESFIGED